HERARRYDEPVVLAQRLRRGAVDDDERALAERRRAAEVADRTVRQDVAARPAELTGHVERALVAERAAAELQRTDRDGRGGVDREHAAVVPDAPTVGVPLRAVGHRDHAR